VLEHQLHVSHELEGGPGRGPVDKARGTFGGHRLGYGDVVTVRITSADWESGQLELALDGPTPEKMQQRPRRPRKRTRPLQPAHLPLPVSARVSPERA
jgi:hypothetical protein